MPKPQARDRLLTAAVAHALRAGIADLSLRQLAAQIGTSHRMLIYHFGSREGLLVAVTQAVEATQRAAAFTAGATAADARRFWERISDPQFWPQERLFFELYAQALLGRPGTEGFLDGIIESWAAPLVAAMVEAGVDEEIARAEARLSVAVTRGLLLDLLATGDRQAVTKAFERYLRRDAWARDRNFTGSDKSAVGAVPRSPKRATSARGERTDQRWAGR